MKFDAILEYQRVDQELINLENEATSSKELATLYSAKKTLDTATGTIGKLSAEAGEIIANQAKIQEKITALKAKLDEFDGIVEGIEAVSEADYYLKQIDAIISEIISLEKESSKEMNHIDGVTNEYKKTWEAGMKASEGYKQAKLAYDKYMASMQPKALEIKAKLNELRKEVPDPVFNAYKTLRDGKKLPAFVEYDAEKKVCGRCRMDVPNDTAGKLRQSGDYAECPNCRRILYMP
jgi:predicted  nucleic acid-binding Zn-ribbon protein